MAIQFLRGSGHSSTSTLAVGQPYYDTANELLFMGVGSTSTLAELNSITYNASRWLQVGYVYYCENTEDYDSLHVAYQFFTDTVYDANTWVSSFTGDHVYEAYLANGDYWYTTTSRYPIVCLYVPSTTTMQIYYTTAGTYNYTLYTTQSFGAAILTFVPIATKKVTSN